MELRGQLIDLPWTTYFGRKRCFWSGIGTFIFAHTDSMHQQ